MFRSTLPAAAAAVAAAPIPGARPLLAVTWTAIPPPLADPGTCCTEYWNDPGWTAMSSPAAVTELTSAATPLDAAIVRTAGSAGPVTAANPLTRLIH